MSLAIPLQARGERASQVLPSVNCSTCHVAIPIVELGSHVCSAPPPMPASSTSSFSAPKPFLPTNRASTASNASSSSRWLPQRRPSQPEPEPPLKPPSASLFTGGSQGRRGSNSSIGSSSSNRSPSMGNRGLPPPGSPQMRPPAPARGQTLPPIQTAPNPPYASGSSSSSALSPHLPRPSISNQQVYAAPLPSPPLNPYQLRPSPTDPSPRDWNQPASSFHAPTPSYARSSITRTPSPVEYLGIGGKSTLLKTEAGGNAGMAGVGRRAFATATAPGANQTLYPHSLYTPVSPILSPSSPVTAYPPLPASSSGHGSNPSHSSASSHRPTGSSHSNRPPGPSRNPSATSSGSGSDRPPQDKRPFLDKYQELVRSASYTSSKGLGLGRGGLSDGSGGGRQSAIQDEAEPESDEEDSDLPWARHDDDDDKPASIRGGLLQSVRETSTSSDDSSYSGPGASTVRGSVPPKPSNRPVSPPSTASSLSHDHDATPRATSKSRKSGFRIEEEDEEDERSDPEDDRAVPARSGSLASSSSASHGPAKSVKASSLMTPSTSLDRLTREELTARAVTSGDSGVVAFQRMRNGSQGSSGSGGSSSGASSAAGRILAGMKARLGVEELGDLKEEGELTEEPMPISPTSANDLDDNLDGPVRKPSAGGASTSSAGSSAAGRGAYPRPGPPATANQLRVTPPPPSAAAGPGPGSASSRSRSPSPLFHTNSNPSATNSPSLSASTASSIGGLAVPGPSKRKECLQCGDHVGGSSGRKYVQMKEGAGVLCERDWKQMYLPKCRRCALPIESQAISSADGQLKGKYHRACFTCYACDRPFDGQTFWVHGSKPYCEIDYHRENNSLCALPSCGLPIEGPCAVISSSTGVQERYHTHCLRCSEPGRDCRNSMDEHYDVGGKRYCRTHIEGAWQREGGAGGKTGPTTPRPTKRRTLMMELPKVAR